MNMIYSISESSQNRNSNRTLKDMKKLKYFEIEKISNPKHEKHFAKNSNLDKNPYSEFESLKN